MGALDAEQRSERRSGTLIMLRGNCHERQRGVCCQSALVGCAEGDFSAGAVFAPVRRFRSRPYRDRRARHLCRVSLQRGACEVSRQGAAHHRPLEVPLRRQQHHRRAHRCAQGKLDSNESRRRGGFNGPARARDGPHESDNSIVCESRRRSKTVGVAATQHRFGDQHSDKAIAAKAGLA